MIAWDNTPRITLRWAGLTFSEAADQQFRATFGNGRDEWVEQVASMFKRDVQAELSHLAPDDEVPASLTIRNAKLVGLVTLTATGENVYQVSIHMVTEAEAEAASSV